MKTDRLSAERPKPNDERSEGQKDCDRILYTSAFMRLGGVSQVAHADDGTVVHNRLTHALKVATLGRGLANRLVEKQRDLAESLGGLDSDIVAAGSLAHDLGHPPFGHVAERVLQKILEEKGQTDSFEGNAQSFRVVTQLAVRKSDYRGLNLTRGTLNCILKYPWMRRTFENGPEAKWSAYGTETKEFNFAREGCEANRKCVEAEVMDYADDVAYSTHDLEDFYRAGLLPLDRILSDSRERERFLEAAALKGEEKNMAPGVFDGLLKRTRLAGDLLEPFNGLRKQRAAIRSYCSTLIDRFFDGIALAEPKAKDAPFVQFDPEIKLEIKLLKKLVFHYVIGHQLLATQEHGQQQVIRKLFEVFYASLMSKRGSEEARMIPQRYREHLNEVAPEGSQSNVADMQAQRIAVDIIAEMTEHQAAQTYLRLTGHVAHSLLDLAHR